VEEEISLVEIGQVLVKRWKLLIFLPLLAVLIAYGVSNYILTPKYVSSSTLIVMPFTETLEGGAVIRHDIESTRQVVQSCKELTMSMDSMQRVIGELNLPYTANELRSIVTITVGDVTTVTVTDPNPVRAFDINNQVTQVFMEFITGAARLDNVQLLNPAQVPLSPDSPRVGLNMAIAFVLGLMIAVALAFLFEHLDNTIKTSDDVQKYLGLPVLGVIPEFEEEGKR
jgi:capsular polysaccharide biosynthesis protein